MLVARIQLNSNFHKFSHLK